MCTCFDSNRQIVVTLQLWGAIPITVIFRAPGGANNTSTATPTISFFSFAAIAGAHSTMVIWFSCKCRVGAQWHSHQCTLHTYSFAFYVDLFHWLGGGMSWTLFGQISLSWLTQFKFFISQNVRRSVWEDPEPKLFGSEWTSTSEHLLSPPSNIEIMICQTS